MASQTFEVSTGVAEGSYPQQVIGMNGHGYPNKLMGVYNMAPSLNIVDYRCPGKSGQFDAKNTFNGVQNQPNSTNEKSYVLDAKGLHWIDLDYQDQGVICTNGTGAMCADNFNNATTLIKSNGNSDWATEDSCGFNFNLGGMNNASMTYDNSSGFATEMMT